MFVFPIYPQIESKHVRIRHVLCPLTTGFGGGGAAIAMTYLILIINMSVKKLQVMVIFLPELSSFDSPYIGIARSRPMIRVIRNVRRGAHDG